VLTSGRTDRINATPSAVQAAYLLFPLYSGGSLAELGERLAAEQRSLPTIEVLHLFLQVRVAAGQHNAAASQAHVGCTTAAVRAPALRCLLSACQLARYTCAGLRWGTGHARADTTAGAP